MKTCFKCNRLLPLEEFYAHPAMPDGHVNKCKECNKKDVTKNRNAKIDYYRKYDVMRSGTPERKASGEKQRKLFRQKYRHKSLAHSRVMHAIESGKLVRPPACEACGKPGGDTRQTKLHGHHDDYSKPLCVRWLCVRCHSDTHQKLKSRVIQ